uniref:Uncharacterized protein n=1 Tax=viral metagenome TaxID=1070528 RepID=A0A6C0IS23_9ZZZZ
MPENTRKTTDLRMPTKTNGSKDKRYKDPQMCNKNGQRDKRCNLTNKKRNK